MATIRVTVIAAADPSMRTVFAPLEQAQARAYSKMNSAAKRAAKEQSASMQDVTKGGGGYRSDGRAAEMAEKAERAKTRALEKGEADRLRIRMRSEAQDSRRDRSRTVHDLRDFGRDAIGTAGRGARAVMGFAGNVARGAGIDTSVAGLTGKVVRTESAAIRATLSGSMAENAKRKSRGEAEIAPTPADVQNTLHAVHRAGDQTSTKYGDVAAGLEGFVARSSDLEGGKSMLYEMGKIAKATGTDFVELATAAGSISQTMGEYSEKMGGSAQKGRDLAAALRLVATQGAQGSVEIKDMAVYMPRLAAAARQLSGDYTKNLGEMGTLAQVAILGGRSTAGEATTAASSLAIDLTQKNTLKRLTGAGIQVTETEGPDKGKVKGMQQIVQAVYAKTGGDISQIASLFVNKQSGAAVRAFRSAYRGDDNSLQGADGKTLKGADAIEALFKKFSASTSKEMIDAGFGIAKDSKEGKADAFQNKLENIASATLDKLMPALERLGPKFEALADIAVAFMVKLAGMDPGAVLALAIGASVVKAGISTVLSRGIENAILGAGGGAGAGVGGSGGGGLGSLASLIGGMGPAATALGIFTAAVIAAGIGMALIDKGFKDKEKKEKEQHEAETKGLNAQTEMQFKEGRGPGAKDPDKYMESLLAKQADLEAKTKQGGAYNKSPDILGNTDWLAENIFGGFGTDAGVKRDTDRELGAKQSANLEELANVRAEISTMKSALSGTLQVNVVNMPGTIGLIGVPTAARTWDPQGPAPASMDSRGGFGGQGTRH